MYLIVHSSSKHARCTDAVHMKESLIQGKSIHKCVRLFIWILTKTCCRIPNFKKFLKSVCSICLSVVPLIKHVFWLLKSAEKYESKVKSFNSTHVLFAKNIIFPSSTVAECIFWWYSMDSWDTRLCTRGQIFKTTTQITTVWQGSYRSPTLPPPNIVKISFITNLPPPLSHVSKSCSNIVVNNSVRVINCLYHRKRIKTEEKAMVVTSVWRAEWIKFLVAL